MKMTKQGRFYIFDFENGTVMTLNTTEYKALCLYFGFREELK